MNKAEALAGLRRRLSGGKASIGSWMQIPNASVAEIMGSAGFDWVTVDLEHGSFSTETLPDIFRALELGGTIPLARVAECKFKDCRQALDAGAAGIILPRIETASQLTEIQRHCYFPPRGERGVGFSRANRFGMIFDDYVADTERPLIIAMIESKKGIENLSAIVECEDLDGILIGPYDLAASLGVGSNFEAPLYLKTLEYVRIQTIGVNLPVGIHVVNPCIETVLARRREGYRLIAYSMDAVILSRGCSISID